MKNIKKYMFLGLLLVIFSLPDLVEAGNLSDNSFVLVRNFYGDKRARKVGDLLTVKIVEEASAKKDASQSGSKSFDIGGEFTFYRPRIDDRPQPWTNFNLKSFSVKGDRKYDGKGSLENKDALSGLITVKVMEVLPNGNLLIEGKRAVQIQKESVTFTLSGTVRPEDINSDNIVLSTAIADASIKYESNGTVTVDQKKGLVTRVFDWLNLF
jgi:flagellar L-ring protein precursor FlgH